MKKFMVGLLLLVYALFLAGCGADTSGIAVTCNGPNNCAPIYGIGANISEAGGLSSSSASFLLTGVRSGGQPAGTPSSSSSYKISAGISRH